MSLLATERRAEVELRFQYVFDQTDFPVGRELHIAEYFYFTGAEGLSSMNITT